MQHSADFFRIAGSWNKIFSVFTEAVKVTVFQKIGHTVGVVALARLCLKSYLKYLQLIFLNFFFFFI
jgi:hypothetical protein